jgi:hypothetical protein
MDTLQIAIISLLLILMYFTLFGPCAKENYIGGEAGYALGPSFDTVDSGTAAPYAGPYQLGNGAYVISRWRPAPPVFEGARQVTDDTWDRTYNSNVGFYLA